jgi:hypothetical protein
VLVRDRLLEQQAQEEKSFGLNQATLPSTYVHVREAMEKALKDGHALHCATGIFLAEAIFQKVVAENRRRAVRDPWW